MVPPIATAAATLLLLLLLLLLLSLSPAGSSSPAHDASGASQTAPSTGEKQFSLDSYSAHGDGTHDDSLALQNAWTNACNSPQPAVLLVPGGRKYLLEPVTLSGPCKSSSVVFKVTGTLVASPNRSDWTGSKRRYWIELKKVDGLTVTGGGTVDGNGKDWWKWKRSWKAKKSQTCKDAPTALTFHFCKNLTVENLKIVNSQQIHVAVKNCTGVRLSRLSITAPGDSPNTDGIHVTHSSAVHVSDCKIETGDDCISIESGTSDLTVTGGSCGPGHGISIGSLGDGGAGAQVSGVTVDGVHLRGTTNGARIKTYPGGSGYARDIVFKNMAMDGVENPIIINQSFCDHSTGPCGEEGSSSAVEVSNVTFSSITGTTTSKDAITLNCSKNVPCHGITLDNIDLRTTKGGAAAAAAASSCRNAKCRALGAVVPRPDCCIITK